MPGECSCNPKAAMACLSGTKSFWLCPTQGVEGMLRVKNSSPVTPVARIPHKSLPRSSCRTRFHPRMRVPLARSIYKSDPTRSTPSSHRNALKSQSTPDGAPTGLGAPSGQDGARSLDGRPDAAGTVQGRPDGEGTLEGRPDGAGSLDGRLYEGIPDSIQAGVLPDTGLYAYDVAGGSGLYTYDVAGGSGLYPSGMAGGSGGCMLEPGGDRVVVPRDKHFSCSKQELLDAILAHSFCDESDGIEQLISNESPWNSAARPGLDEEGTPKESSARLGLDEEGIPNESSARLGLDEQGTPNESSARLGLEEQGIPNDSSARPGLDERRTEFLEVCSICESILHAKSLSVLESLRENASALSNSFMNIPMGGENIVAGISNTRNSGNSRGSTSKGQEVGKLGPSLSADSGNGAEVQGTQLLHGELLERQLVCLLSRAQYSSLGVEDMELSERLSADSLLALPITVPRPKLSDSDQEGQALKESIMIFRRGFTVEKQQGRMLGAKFDFLLAVLLKGILSSVLIPVRMGVEASAAAASKAWAEACRLSMAVKEQGKRYLQDEVLEQLERAKGEVIDEVLDELERAKGEAMDSLKSKLSQTLTQDLLAKNGFGDASTSLTNCMETEKEPILNEEVDVTLRRDGSGELESGASRAVLDSLNDGPSMLDTACEMGSQLIQEMKGGASLEEAGTSTSDAGTSILGVALEVGSPLMSEKAQDATSGGSSDAASLQGDQSVGAIAKGILKRVLSGSDESTNEPANEPANELANEPANEAACSEIGLDASRESMGKANETANEAACSDWRIPLQPFYRPPMPDTSKSSAAGTSDVDLPSSADASDAPESSQGKNGSSEALSLFGQVSAPDGYRWSVLLSLLSALGPKEKQEGPPCATLLYDNRKSMEQPTRVLRRRRMEDIWKLPGDRSTQLEGVLESDSGRMRSEGSNSEERSEVFDEREDLRVTSNGGVGTLNPGNRSNLLDGVLKRDGGGMRIEGSNSEEWSEVFDEREALRVTSSESGGTVNSLSAPYEERLVDSKSVGGQRDGESVGGQQEEESICSQQEEESVGGQQEMESVGEVENREAKGSNKGSGNFSSPTQGAYLPPKEGGEVVPSSSSPSMEDKNVSSMVGEKVSSLKGENVSTLEDKNVSSMEDKNVSSMEDENVSSMKNENVSTLEGENVTGSPTQCPPSNSSMEEEKDSSLEDAGTNLLQKLQEVGEVVPPSSRSLLDNVSASSLEDAGSNLFQKLQEVGLEAAQLSSASKDNIQGLRAYMQQLRKARDQMYSRCQEAVAPVTFAVSAFISSTTLEDPAHEDLVVIHSMDIESATPTPNPTDLLPSTSMARWRKLLGVPGPMQEEKSVDETKRVVSLRIYRSIPVPGIKVVFPNKKLTFRPFDALRLDLTTLIGLVAYLINYRFEDALSSPSAFILDLVSAGAFFLLVIRSSIGYLQTSNRYQLLVNKELNEKTVAVAFPAMLTILDEYLQQQVMEVILSLAVLHLWHEANPDKPLNAAKFKALCEEFMQNQMSIYMEFPVEGALDLLSSLNIANVSTTGLEAVDTGINPILHKKTLADLYISIVPKPLSNLKTQLSHTILHSRES